jgi:hypothetical protein
MAIPPHHWIHNQLSQLRMGLESTNLVLRAPSPPHSHNCTLQDLPLLT